MLSRAVLRAIDDAGGFQLIQVGIRQGELRDGVEHFQPYGFAFRPHAGAQAVVAYLGGCGNHPVALVVADPRHRLRDLETGEVALYTDEGDTIVLRRDRRIEVTAGAQVTVTAPTVELAATTKVLIDAPLVEVTGNLEVAGNVQAAGNVTDNAGTPQAGTMAGMRTTYNLHTHPDPHGGNTGAPNQSMGGA